MSQTPENIHEATKADAEAALSETLAQFGLSPDTRVAVKTADAAAAPTPPAMPDAVLAASVQLSPEQEKQLKNALAALEVQGQYWTTNISSLNDQGSFNKLTTEAAANGKYTVQSGPGFVTGKALSALIQQFGISDDTVAAQVKQRAYALQDELGELYRAKRTELYSVAADQAGVSMRKPVSRRRGAQRVRTAPGAQAPTAAPTSPKAPDATASFDQHETIAVGQVWTKEVSGPQGTTTRTIKITEAYPQNKMKIEEGYATKKPSGGFSSQGSGSYTASVDEIREKLRSEGYRLDRGGASTIPATPEPTAPVPKVEPDRRMDAALGAALAGGAAAAAAAAAEAPKGPEGAPARPETGPALPGRTLDQVQDEIDRVSELTNAARKEYVRIEHEANQGWEKIKRVFRNLRGSEETGPDVLRAKQDYEQKLLALKELELEKVKLSGLRGEALREHLAAVIVEYNFNEAERFDDDRREQRLGAAAVPFKEKWNSIRDSVSNPTWKDWIKIGWERSNLIAGAAVGSAGAVGKAYNKVMGTTVGKVAVYGASATALGVLVFSGGGAAAAIGGGWLVAKRIAGGLGATQLAIEGSDKVARWNRKRAANNEAIEGASAVMGASKLEQGEIENIEISPDGLRQLEAALKKDTSWRGKAAKRELWRQSRIWGSWLLGGAIASGMLWPGTNAVATEATDEQVREVARRGAAAASGAVRGVAEAASAPGGAASAAQAAAETVNAPAAAASAADTVTSPAIPASAAEGGVIQAPNTPDTLPSGAPEAPDDGGEPATRTETPGSAGAEQPAASGRPEAIRLLTEAWEIKPGATIGRLAVMAAQEAGIEDQAAQRRFARLLVEHINTRLAAATGEVAEAAGFIPHPDGSYTADLIPANSELNLTRIGVTPSDIENLLTQAETGVTPPAAPLAEAVVAGGGETAVTATEGSSTEVPTAPGAIAVAEASAPTTSPATPAEAATGSVRAEGMGETSVRSEITGRTDADYTADETIRRRIATLEYIKSLDKTEQVQLYSSSKSLVKQLLSTAEVMGDNTDVRYDPTSRKLGGAWVARILGDYAGLKESSSYVIDTTINPLHRSQMEGVRAFALAVEEAFGKEFARPAPRESVQEYVLRSMALAKAKGITLPGMVN